MILIDVVLEAKPNCDLALKNLLLETMSASLKEDGCRQYRFTADLENSQRFYLLELWADEEAFKGHIKGRPFKHFIASLGEFGRVIKSERLHGSLEPYEIQR